MDAFGLCCLTWPVKLVSSNSLEQVLGLAHKADRTCGGDALDSSKERELAISGYKASGWRLDDSDHASIRPIPKIESTPLLELQNLVGCGCGANMNTSKETALFFDRAPLAAAVGEPPPRALSIARRLRVRRFRPGLILAGLFTALLVVASIEPGWVAPGDPLEANAREAFQAPSSGHFLGTDENGRDVLIRIVYGARASLVTGLAATAIGLGVGISLGLAAGLSHPVIDGAIMRFIDMLLAFPDLLLALVIITFWGQGMFNTVVAVGVASIPRYARMVRAQAHVVRRTQYVEAALTLGLNRPTLIARHILPNAIKPIVLLGLIGVGGKIAAGASLSFLGFGAPPPSPEWGSMLSTGRDFLGNAWWLTAVPGFAITLTVLSVTALGREVLRRSEGRTR